MQEKLVQAENARDIAEIKRKECDVIIDTIQNEPNEIQRKFILAQRTVASLKANELILVRRHSAMQDIENHLRKENAVINADLIALDKTARETIMRLLITKSELTKKNETLLSKIDGICK